MTLPTFPTSYPNPHENVQNRKKGLSEYKYPDLPVGKECSYVFPNKIPRETGVLILQEQLAELIAGTHCGDQESIDFNGSHSNYHLVHVRKVYIFQAITSLTIGR